MLTYSATRGLLAAAVLAALPAAPLFATADSYIGASGLWSTAANWSPAAVPVNGDDVTLGVSTSPATAITFASTYTGAGLNSLTINPATVTTLTLNQTSASTMIATIESLGTTTFGAIYNQTAGANTVTGTLNIGSAAASISQGVYQLAGTGILNAGQVNVGNSNATSLGGNAFVQSGGAANIAILDVANLANSTGTYTLSAGALNISSAENIGDFGNATFTQTGGNHTILGSSDFLYIGGNSLGATIGAGTYNLSSTAGAASLLTPYEVIGDQGTGTFNQSGGTHTVSFNLYLGSNSAGTYNLSNGSLSAGTVFLGILGNGTITQTGGSVSVSNILLIAAQSAPAVYTLSNGSLSAASADVGENSNGNFTLSSTGNATFGGTLSIGSNATASGTVTLGATSTGTLTANFERVGDGGAGLFLQNGGTHKVTSDLALGFGTGSTGTYQLNGGTLTDFSLEVGQFGNGVFNQTGGNLSVSNTFTIASAAGSAGTYNLSNGNASLATLNVGNNAPGTLSQTGGVLSGGTVTLGTNANATVNHSGGTFTVSSILYVGLGNFTTTYNLSGSGNLTLPNNPASFQEGFISPNSVFNESGGNVNGYLTNDGLFNFTGGSFAGTLQNAVGGTVTLSYYVYFGGLTNAGTINAAGQFGTAANQTLTNTGTINLSAGGQIYALGPILNNGIINATNSTIGGTQGFTNNLVVTQGPGALTLTAATLNYGAFTLATGRTFTMYGNLTNYSAFAVNGALILNQGGILTNAAGGTLTGPGTIATPFANGGTVVPGSGTLTFSNPWSNTGVVELSGLTSAVTGAFIANYGTIQGFGTVGANVTNSGTLEAIGGTLVLSGVTTNTSSGLITATTGNKVLATIGITTNAGLISLAGGTFDNGSSPIDSTGQISGYGILRTGGLTNDGLFTLTGTNGSTSIVDGNVTNTPTHTLNVKLNPAIFTGTVINNAGATVKTTSTTATFTGTFTNNGIYTSDPSTNIFQGPVTTGATGSMTGGSGDVYIFLSGTFANAGIFNNAGTLQSSDPISNSGTFTQSGPQSWSATTGTFTNTAGTATFSSNAKLANLTITGGTVNLTTSKFIIEPTNKTATLVALQANANSGALTASGLAPNLALAIIDNGSLATPFSLFGGLPADAGSILIAPELLGDANIDGRVDLNDLTTVLNHLGTPDAGWTWGGFDGAATIDLNDLNAVLNHLGTSYANSSSVVAAQSLLPATIPTPEPSSFALLATIVPILKRRRHHYWKGR